MKRTSNIFIQPIIVEKQIVTQVLIKNKAKCQTNKIEPISLKQKIIDRNKRNNNIIIINTTLEENIKKTNFVAHWVPERFISLVCSFYFELETIQELWKVVRQRNKVVTHVTGHIAFNKDQELIIGLKAIKEFVMKIKSEPKMNKGKFAYFNEFVNNLMDQYYFDNKFISI